MTAPKLGRRVLTADQRLLLRQYSHWVRDGMPIPEVDRDKLRRAMETAGAPTAQDGRRQIARDRKRIEALERRASAVKKK